MMDMLRDNAETDANQDSVLLSATVGATQAFGLRSTRLNTSRLVPHVLTQRYMDRKAEMALTICPHTGAHPGSPAPTCTDALSGSHNIRVRRRNEAGRAGGKSDATLLAEEAKFVRIFGLIKKRKSSHRGKRLPSAFSQANLKVEACMAIKSRHLFD